MVGPCFLIRDTGDFGFAASARSADRVASKASGAMFPIAECRWRVLQRLAQRYTAREAVVPSGNAAWHSNSSRLRVALKLSASELSALDPVPLMDSVTFSSL